MEQTMLLIVDAAEFTTDAKYNAFFALFDTIETANLLYYVEKENN